MSETIELRKDRILNAAESCPTAKEILKQLFPEIFNEKSMLKVGNIVVPRGCKDPRIIIGIPFGNTEKYYAIGFNGTIGSNVGGGTLESLEYCYKKVAENAEQYFRGRIS